MVSLCGLALSSLFVLNNKSVVHADTVSDNNQNNAISWNSDSDAAQNAQNTQKADDDQQNAAQPMQSRAEMSTVRSSSEAPRTTNQNTAVQSPRVANVQDAQKTSPVVINNPANNKVHVHYIDANGNAVKNSSYDDDIDAAKTGQGSYTVPSGYSLNNPDGKYTVSGAAFGAATLKGNVKHHDARTRLDHIKVGTSTGTKHDVTVYNNGQRVSNDVAKAYLPSNIRSLPDLAVTGVHEKGGVDPRNRDAQKVDIDYKYTKYEDKTTVLSPAYTTQTLPVAFVDSNNNIVGMIQNYSGKVGTTQSVSLTVPTGYKLTDGMSLPTSVTFQNSTDPLLIDVVPSGETQRITNPYRNTINVEFVDQTTGQQVGTDTIDLTKAQNGTNYYNAPAGYGADVNSYYVDSKSSKTGIYLKQLGKTVYPDSPNGYDSRLANAMFSNLRKDDAEYGDLPSGQGFNLTYHDDGRFLTGGYRGRKLDLSVNDVHYWADRMAYAGYSDSVARIDAKLISDGGRTSFTDNLHTISGNTVTVPVHESTTYQFADNSGNVKSVNGNTVNVILTKPQSVNPASDTRCHSQATRTIQINFPDGQIPQSYDGIVDKSGKLVQTVYFTRTATEDALTGNILQYGNWTSDNQDPNFIGFPERTLPRIPGYTLSIKPAAANA